MKRLFLYAIFATLTISCTKQDVGFGHDDKSLKVNVELLSSSTWTSRAVDDKVILGNSIDTEDGQYVITGQKEDWNAHCEQMKDTQVEGPVTRGTPITSASAINNMSMNIFQTGTSNWTTSSSRTAALVATKSGNGFTISPNYNWATDPTTKTSVFAYSPVALSSNGLTDASSNKVNYTVPTDVTLQPDLCVATPAMNIVNNDGIQHIRTFQMTHQLTAVGFTMLGWNLKITQITVSGIAVTGTLTMNTSGAPSWSTSTTGSRNVGVTQSSHLHDADDNYVNITNSNGYLMMIPQTLSDAATVTITYASTGTGSSGGTLTAKLKDLGVTWTAGDKITYNIRLKTAPAVTSDDIIIDTPTPGYTSTAPLSLFMDRHDKLTFTWSASWLKIHRGAVRSGDASGGGSSPWSSGSGGPWDNIYFFATTENPSSTAERTAQVTVSGTRSGTKTFTVKQAKQLSALDYTTESANCYVTYPQNGKMLTLKFSPRYRPVAKYANGNSTPVNTTGANPSTASQDSKLGNQTPYVAGDKIEITWQTAVNHGTTGGMENMVIKSVTMDTDGLVTVEVNGPGNALLSYKRGGSILWNYHIWATDSNPFEKHSITGGNVNGSTPNGQAMFMDRNMGALSATATTPSAADAYKYFGLMYQHGRPTPFTGQGAGTTANTYTKIFDASGTEKTSQIGGYATKGAAVSSVTSAIQNPNTYYAKPGSPYTWYNFADISLWSDYGTNKSIYDPCPYGYRVPRLGSWSSWTSISRRTGSPIDGGAVWSSTWWPAAGCRWGDSDTGKIGGVGSSGYYWTTARSSTYEAYVLNLDFSRGKVNGGGSAFTHAQSVRCVQEGW